METPQQNRYKGTAKPERDNVTSEDLDQLNENLKKNGRNKITFLDNIFNIVTHPTFLCLIFVCLGILYIALDCVAICIENDNLNTIRNNVKEFLSYLLTIVITYVATSLIDHIKRLREEKIKEEDFEEE